MQTRADLPPAADERAAGVLRRVKRNSIAAAVLFTVPAAISGGFAGLVGLTCSAAVTMISFLWLEEIVDAILQPSPQLHARRLVIRTLVRFALLGAALSVSIFVVRFNAVSVLLGFSIVVVGIIGEAVYVTFRKFAG